MDNPQSEMIAALEQLREIADLASAHSLSHTTFADLMRGIGALHAALRDDAGVTQTSALLVARAAAFLADAEAMRVYQSGVSRYSSPGEIAVQLYGALGLFLDAKTGRDRRLAAEIFYASTLDVHTRILGRQDVLADVKTALGVQ